MRKPAFCIFCGLCILTSFSLLTVNVRGYQISIAYCLFFIFFFWGGGGRLEKFDHFLAKIHIERPTCTGRQGFWPPRKPKIANYLSIYSLVYFVR